MSEHLAAARELVRAAIDQIDARLAELHAESVDLTAHRARLRVVIDGEGSTSPPSEVTHARVTQTPAARPVLPPATTTYPITTYPPARTPSGRSRASEVTGVFRVDAANRILAWLDKHGTATAPELVAASKVSKPTMTRVVTDLLQTKRLVRTGLRRATRYTLPSGGRAQPAAAAADSEGDRGAKRGGRR